MSNNNKKPIEQKPDFLLRVFVNDIPVYKDAKRPTEGKEFASYSTQGAAVLNILNAQEVGTELVVKYDEKENERTVYITKK